MTLASFCGYTGWLVSYLVENSKDRFSRDEAHLISKQKTNPNREIFRETVKADIWAMSWENLSPGFATR